MAWEIVKKIRLQIRSLFLAISYTNILNLGLNERSNLHRNPTLMRKTEVQPTVPNIRRRLQVMSPLLRRHTTPKLVALPISPHIVYLRERVQDAKVY